MSVQDLILEGERVREHGDPQTAIGIFHVALPQTTKYHERSAILGHLGLCYEHLGKLEQANNVYTELENYAQKAGMVLGVANAQRHRSSVEVKQGNHILATELALAAVTKVRNRRPNPPYDLVWYQHGVTKAIIAEHKKKGGQGDKAAMRTQARKEFQDLFYAWRHEKSWLKKWVWTTGWLADASYAWAPWSWPLGALAFLISILTGLKLRKKQILTGKL